jgi:hypothetical protein
MKKLIIISLVAISLASCTENSKAKNWGGTAYLTLPAGQKLVNVTWKDAELWYITRPMRKDEFPETYTFNEESNWGVMEGSYIIKETK